MSYQYTTKKLHNEKNEEKGSVLTVNAHKPTNALEKATIEQFLINEAFTKIYPGKGLHIYSEYHTDTPSIIVLKDFDRI